MNDLTTPIPTVEQINLEYRLSQSKASEAVQHAINCGLMLLQVKAGLAHGEWLPWLKQQQEAGAIEFTERTASKYMKVAANRNHGSDLIEAPSIRAALELLSEDKAATDQTALDLETAKEREAREAAEAVAKREAEARAVAEQRSEDWRQQAIQTKHALTEAEQKLQNQQAEAAALRRTLAAEAERLAEARLQEVKAEVSVAKSEQAKLKDTIKSLKREREDAVARGVNNKLREQQTDLDRKEAHLVALEERIAFLQQSLSPLEGAQRAAAHHRPRIAKVDSLINAIAVEIGDAFDPDLSPDLPSDIAHEWLRGAAKIGQVIDILNQYLAPIGGDNHGLEIARR